MIQESNKLMIIGTKESFLIRSLIKKMKESNLDAFFTIATVDAINKAYEDAFLIAIYLDPGEVVDPKVLTYLKDRMGEHPKHLFVIGEKQDIDDLGSVMSVDYITRSFERPLNVEEFIELSGTYLDDSMALDTKKTILIVDDDPTYMGMVRDWLKDSYNVYMAKSGTQALKTLGNTTCDLILLDYEMPVVTGPQVLQMLREEPDTRSIPVIFLTGKNDKESIMKVLALKPEGYLLKTILKDDLLKELTKIFNKI